MGESLLVHREKGHKDFHPSRDSVKRFALGFERLMRVCLSYPPQRQDLDVCELTMPLIVSFVSSCFG